MWYFGVLAGLFIGTIAQSLPAAIIFALLGGIIVNFVTRQRGAQDAPARKPRAQAPELIDLQRKIMVLEQRLQIVEAQLAEGFSSPARTLSKLRPATQRKTPSPLKRTEPPPRRRIR